MACRDVFRKETNAESRIDFAVALCRIDGQQTEAFVFLTGNLTNENDNQVRKAAYGLSKMGPGAKPAIPILLDVLGTTNYSVFTSVVYALKAIGYPHDLLMEKIRSSFNSKNDRVRAEACSFVLENDKADREAQDVLVKIILRHSEAEPRAIAVLGRAGPAAIATLPVILSVLDGTNTYSWMVLSHALTNMGVSPEIFLPALEKKIAPGSVWERNDYFNFLDISTEVQKLDPGNRNAQLALILLMGHNYFYEDRGIIESLSHAKPAIPEVLPTLQKLLKSKHDDVRREAAKAIKKLKANNALN